MAAEAQIIKTSAMEDTRDVVTFAFVNDQSPHDSRSHAMREHWKKRRKTKSTDLQSSSSSSSAFSTPLPLLPRVKQSNSISNSGTAHASGGGSSSKRRSTSKSPKKATSSLNEPGIPAQAFSGLNLALGACRLDPFDQFPVKLTAQHHKLLLHCEHGTLLNRLSVLCFAYNSVSQGLTYTRP